MAFTICLYFKNPFLKVWLIFQVRAEMGPQSYMLKAYEELWEKEMTPVMEELLKLVNINPTIQKDHTVNVLKFWTPKFPTNANSADLDQTAPEGAVWSGSTLFAISLSIARNNCIKSKL